LGFGLNFRLPVAGKFAAFCQIARTNFIGAQPFLPKVKIDAAGISAHTRRVRKNIKTKK